VISSRRLAVLFPVCWVLWAVSCQAQDHAAPFERALQAGEWSRAESILRDHLDAHPEDAEAQFGLGLTQYLRVTEWSSHSSRRASKDLEALPLTSEPSSDVIAEVYPVFRGLLSQLIQEVTVVDATLAGISDDDVKLRVAVNRIRLDLNGDGHKSEKEVLLKLLSGRSVNHDSDQNTDFIVAFDKSDVHWFRSQCHLVMALCEFLLAHDWRATLEFRFFEGKTPFDSMVIPIDGIAAFHVIDWPVLEPERMKSVLEHLEVATRQLQATHTAIAAETDNDREWIAGHDQVNVLLGKKGHTKVLDRRVQVLEELEMVLAGKKLAPLLRDVFYEPQRNDTRSRNRQGVNVRRIFTEPGRFDLVLWLQGSAAEPYLEQGDINHGFWRTVLQSMFTSDWREFHILPFL